MDLDPLDYLVDYTAPDFLQKAEESRQAEQQASEKQKALEEQSTMLDLAQRQATIDLTNIQAKNAMQDNMRQLMVSLDTSFQKWGDLYIKAAKEGVELPPKPDITELLKIAQQTIQASGGGDASRPQGGAPMPQVTGPAAAGEQPQM